MDFLGDVGKLKYTFRLPPVMLGRGLDRLFHFCVKTAQLQIFEMPVFVTTRDVYAQTVCKRLAGFRVEDLVGKYDGLVHYDAMWLGIKAHFRMRGWHYATKSERKLLEQCLMRGFNLSLLPTEIGWPVAGDAFRKSLFVWQSYVLLTVMKHFKVGDVFSLKHLIKLMEIEYQFVGCDGTCKQIAAYLKWLTLFGVTRVRGRHFEYVKMPEISVSMETCLQRDKKFVNVAAKLWQV